MNELPRWFEIRYVQDMKPPSTPKTSPPVWAEIVTMVPGLRGGRPVIRGMRISVGDVLGWLASGMSEGEILEDFPELTEADIRAVLSFAAQRERSTSIASRGDEK